MTTISPRQLSDRLEHGEKVQLLDVRTPAEHAEIHVPDVHLMPLDQIDSTRLASVNGFTKDQPLYIFCRTGNRAKQAAEKLENTAAASSMRASMLDCPSLLLIKIRARGRLHSPTSRHLPVRHLDLN